MQVFKNEMKGNKCLLIQESQAVSLALGDKH